MPHHDERRRFLLTQACQSGHLESYISSFTGLCLMAKEVDELTKATLFITGLANEELRREVRKQHLTTLQDAIRLVHGCAADFEDTPRTHGGEGFRPQFLELRQPPFCPRERRTLKLPWNERQRLLKERCCFHCKQVGHRIADSQSNPLQTTGRMGKLKHTDWWVWWKIGK